MCVQTSGKELNSAGSRMRQRLMTSSSNSKKQSRGSGSFTPMFPMRTQEKLLQPHLVSFSYLLLKASAVTVGPQFHFSWTLPHPCPLAPSPRVQCLTQPVLRHPWERNAAWTQCIYSRPCGWSCLWIILIFWFFFLTDLHWVTQKGLKLAIFLLSADGYALPHPEF